MKVRKKVNAPKVNPVEDKINILKEGIIQIDLEMELLRKDKIAKQEELLSLQIAPFEIGGYALAVVPCGKTAKEKKCLLECDNGTLYLRPVTKDGELSGRRFSYVPIKQTYQEYLKPVEE